MSVAFRVCAVRTCPNSSSLRNPEEVSSTTDAAVSYHSFPWRRGRIAEKWLQVLRIQPLNGSKRRGKQLLRVCSEHFSEGNYYVYPPQTKDQSVKLLKILKAEAVPDRNLPWGDDVDNSDSSCDKSRYALCSCRLHAVASLWPVLLECRPAGDSRDASVLRKVDASFVTR
jgi:hypothetical protein